MEDGDALDLKLSINLKQNQNSSGSISASVGNLQILVLHRIIRIFQVLIFNVRGTILNPSFLFRRSFSLLSLLRALSTESCLL